MILTFAFELCSVLGGWNWLGGKKKNKHANYKLLKTLLCHFTYAEKLFTKVFSKVLLKIFIYTMPVFSQQFLVSRSFSVSAVFTSNDWKTRRRMSINKVVEAVEI